MANTTVPLDHSRAGRVLAGAETVVLDQYALFDKIINIKFIRKSGEYFVIRSDYEVLFDERHAPYFVRCQQKPAISLKYRQVSNSTTINIELRVTNLYLTGGRDDALFAVNGDPVTQAVIQLGYRSQFPDWTQPPLSADTDESVEVTSAENRLKMFYEMGHFILGGGIAVLDTGLQLTVQVLAAYAEGNPPDRVTFFQCVVGNLNYGLQWTQPDDIASYFSNKDNFPPVPRTGINEAGETVDISNEPYTYIEKVLFHLITRRYCSSKFVYRFSDTSMLSDYTEGDEIIQTLEVWDYDVENKVFFTAEEQKDKTTEERWGIVELEQGNIMSIGDAMVLGVVCSVTKTLRDESKRSVIAAHGDIAVIERAPPLTQFVYLGDQLESIKQHCAPSMKWYQKVNGDFLIYSNREHLKTVTSVDDPIFSSVLRETKPIILPAVYDITIAGKREIRCPFVSFISPMQLVVFSSTYQVGSFTGFFVPKREDRWYQVLYADIEFDTTGEANMMKLSCVDVIPEGDDTANASNEEKESAEKDTEEQIKRTLNWVGAGIVSLYTGEKDTTILSSWHQLAQNYIINNRLSLMEDTEKGTYFSDFEDVFSSGTPDIKKAMAVLLKHNEGMSLVTGSKVYEREAVNYADVDPLPWVLRVGDTVEIPRVEMA